MGRRTVTTVVFVVAISALFLACSNNGPTAPSNNSPTPPSSSSLSDLKITLMTVSDAGQDASGHWQYNGTVRLLETGGGLVQAMPQIDADPFLVVNSDNLWVDGPVDALKLLAANWDDERMDALLLLVPLARAHCHRGRGDFHMSATGTLRRRKPNAVAPFVFTGIQMVSKRLFEGELPEGPFSTNILWDRATRQC